MLGADLSKVHILDSKNLDRLDDSGKIILREHLKDLQPHLFVIDTIVAYLPTGVGTQQATDVRPTLRWLADLTAEFQTCGILLRHLRKAESDNALHAGQGSMDFIGVARPCLLAAPDPDRTGQRPDLHPRAQQNEHQWQGLLLAVHHRQ